MDLPLGKFVTNDVESNTLPVGTLVEPTHIIITKVESEIVIHDHDDSQPQQQPDIDKPTNRVDCINCTITMVTVIVAAIILLVILIRN